MPPRQMKNVPRWRNNGPVFIEGGRQSRGVDANRIPAIRFGIPRHWDSIESGPSHRREWQIVQSQFDLRDLSP